MTECEKDEGQATCNTEDTPECDSCKAEYAYYKSLYGTRALREANDPRNPATLTEDERAEKLEAQADGDDVPLRARYWR